MSTTTTEYIAKLEALRFQISADPHPVSAGCALVNGIANLVVTAEDSEDCAALREALGATAQTLSQAIVHGTVAQARLGDYPNVVTEAPPTPAPELLPAAEPPPAERPIRRRR